MTAEMIAPYWMHQQVTAEQYDSWSEEQCAGIEIVDGIVTVTPSASRKHNMLANELAVTLKRAGRPRWLASTDFDVRLRDVPLLNRRPDVVVFRAETIDIMPARPDHLCLVVEIVSPGSETTDRMVKAAEYAQAGIKYYWRIEDATTDMPSVHTYVLDESIMAYQATDVFAGVIKAIAPFPVELDLRAI